MKSKTGPSFKSTYKAPHLFIEDLEDIENIYKNDLKPDTYRIETPEYTYGSISEVSKDNSVLYSLKFSSYSPNVFVEFTPYSATVTSFDHTLDAVGAAEKISEVIRKRERKIFWFLYNRYIYLSWIVTVVIWVTPKQDKIIFIICLLFFAPMLIFYIARFSSIYKESKIELRSIRKTKNFFERNKDQIGVNLITGTIGAIVGVMGTILAYQFKFLK